jgi:hypothetical protein
MCLSLELTNRNGHQVLAKIWRDWSCKARDVNKCCCIHSGVEEELWHRSRAAWHWSSPKQGNFELSIETVQNFYSSKIHQHWYNLPLGIHPWELQPNMWWNKWGRSGNHINWATFLVNMVFPTLYQDELTCYISKQITSKEHHSDHLELYSSWLSI